jgi:quinol monooxygenase YgiN
LDVDPAKVDLFEAAARVLRDAVMRTEPGVAALHAATEAENPGRLHVLEVYDNADAYRAHVQSAHFLTFRAATDGLVAERRLNDMVALGLASKGGLPAGPLVRIAELEIEPANLRSYGAMASAEVTESVSVEPGVLGLYAAALSGDPSRLRFFEIYADEAAYQSHLQSRHFGRYAQATQSMIRAKRLVACRPIFLALRPVSEAFSLE